MQRTAFLEDAILTDIGLPRLVPYIQLHEFEGLLFSSRSGFDTIPGITPAARREIDATIAAFDNPELINDGPETAPSKRIEHLIPSYKKPLMGAYMAMEITMPVLVQKCRRFGDWLEIITRRMTA